MPDLITITDLQTITKLNSNVEARRVATGIEDAHLECEKVLGRTGYALVYATPGDYTALLAYIKPWMAWAAMADAYPDLNSEADKAGVFKKSGQDYSSVNDAELGRKVAKARGRAEARLERLLDHLIDNTATYTWYHTNVNSEERIDGSTRTSAGISLRRSPRQDSFRG